MPILFLVILTSLPGLPQAVAQPAKQIQVPYKLTNTNHVLLRAKINGKGPFNFILDTGAPALFLATKIGKIVGAKADASGWARLGEFEIEGGVKLDKVNARVEDLFQLEGMNGMGMAGVELHGIIGYTILARFQLEFDFTKSKMGWTPLSYNPPAPLGIGGTQAGGMESLGSIMKVMGSLLGKKPQQETVLRGFWGLLLDETPGPATVSLVLPESPAFKAGLMKGDRITKLQGKPIAGQGDLIKAAGNLRANEKLSLTIERDKMPMDLELLTGKGF